MSFYRTLIAAVAAMGLASVAFAADESTNPAQQSTPGNTPAAIQVADDASSTTTTTTSTTTEEKVNINTATAKELMKVKGLNAAKAKAIVSYRKKHGNFNSVDDLKEVAGFKKMKDEQIKKIQDQLTAG
jgi:comEA protein